MVAILACVIYLYTILYSYFNTFFDVHMTIALMVSIIIFCVYLKFKFKRITLFMYTFFILYLSTFNIAFIYLMILPLILGDYKKDFPTLIVALSSIYITGKVDLIPLFALAIAFSIVMKEKYKKENEFIELYDTERKNRYELETAKNQLLKANEDIISVTELNERNRIARALHDNIGHKLVGINMILQASSAVRYKDQDKADELTNKAIKELTDTVDLLRDTVHDLKPNKIVGIKVIEKIIEDYNFCEVSFTTKGDMNTIPSGILALMSQNLKEALTNASKYSSATLIKVNLEVSKKYIRFLIKDNGMGAKEIVDGLGISGMRERVENIGGTFTINKNDGFEVISFLPLQGA